MSREALRELIAKHRGTNALSEGDQSALEGIACDDTPISIPADLEHGDQPATAGTAELTKEGDEVNIRAKLAEMSVPEKVKVAMFGNSTCRGLLILDSNRMIQECVLKNPKLSINEVEIYSRNPNVGEYVLRAISDKKEWVREYSIKCNLVTNPKTPNDIALKWLRYLNSSELRKIAKSKNIPQILAITARKRLAESEK